MRTTRWWSIPSLPATPRLGGRKAVQRSSPAVARMLLELQARSIVVQETSDPEVIVAEWDYDGLVTTTNRSFQVSNIQVSRVRNGQIVASRDYHNHLVLADVLGRLPSSRRSPKRSRRDQRRSIPRRPPRWRHVRGRQTRQTTRRTPPTRSRLKIFIRKS